MTTYWAPAAWLGGDGLSTHVVIDVAGDRITAVRTGIGAAPAGAEQLRGVVLPGLANVHSHAFHRALRGRTPARAGTFWDWRERMYAVAARLQPDTLAALARAVFAEMALAGVTAVGEFHYVHHDRDGRAYAESNAMGEAVIEAASAAGVRLTLLDTCYLRGGVDTALEGVQRRFGDADVHAWATRAGALRARPGVRIGAAIHSVRAVPPEALAAVAAWAVERSAPLHVHVSEQPAENRASRDAYGCTPTSLLASNGVLGARTVAVHATHVDATDVRLLGEAGCGVCLCPTTERDLADGLGAGGDLASAGAVLSAGSDGQSVVDLFEEVRGIEAHERLRTGRRGAFAARHLLAAATSDGHAAIGWPEAGMIAPGALADLVVVRTDSLRMAGTGAAYDLNALVATVTAADVRDVVCGGRRVVRDGRHLLVPDVTAAMEAAVAALT